MAYNTPQIVEIMHREALNINTHPTRHSAMSVPLRASTQAPVCATSNAAYLAIHGNTPLHASRVYNRLHPEEHNPTFLPTIEQHIADRGDSKGKTANQRTPQTTRVPKNGSATPPMSTSESINHYANFSSTRLPLSGFTHY